ncbi:uncharacterized protein ND-15 [Euwallacea fornicatus]|uniref:uncharacterized protein ND-15 n=1 Tax=Euwallacea fornicatus TaxID=995702 RepID=UPI00338F8718
MSILTPYLKSPFTDFTGAVISSQWGDQPCRDMEMKALDCLEAYGIDRGITLKKCETLINDFRECSMKIKQKSRVQAMNAERMRQYKAGERTKENMYSKNPPSPEVF